MGGQGYFSNDTKRYLIKERYTIGTYGFCPTDNLNPIQCNGDYFLWNDILMVQDPYIIPHYLT